MSIVWLIILIVHGLAAGWDFHPLLWWLLVPFGVQDLHDTRKR
jgi:hypothetical protein